MNQADYRKLLVAVQDRLRDRPTIEKAVTRRQDATKDRLNDSRAEWTNALLNVLADVGRDRGFVAEPTRLYFSRDTRGQGHNSRYDHPRRGDDAGEFMNDMTWWSMGPADAWWNQMPDVPLRCELAVECEWGWMEGGDFAWHAEV